MTSVDDRHFFGEKYVQSLLSICTEMPDEDKILDEMRQDLAIRKEITTNIKEQRDVLLKAVEENREDMIEYQEFLQVY